LRLASRDALGVSAVRLVPTDVGAHVVGRQKNHSMAEVLELPTPVVRGAARFHDDRSLRLLGHEGKELSSLGAFPSQHVPRPVRDRDLEDGLCNVYGDASIVRHDGLLLSSQQQRLWHIDADCVAGGVHLINAADEVRVG
jgi:hypothetical protein